MGYGLHETLEIHEIAGFKAVSLTKSKTMKGLVSDPVLKEILMQDVITSSRQLEELGRILSSAVEKGVEA
ncbi:MULTISPECIES: hypothetical protein [unclassified Paenibacillus]|uniref:hypothetical protein n=1 Tax=unclassified Paenibacillus TaxID=185978 RepID=UPI00104634EC|nr:MULTISPECIES: hypothetical protein [unclassified Paenibacillus]NIK71728.1 spore coat protein CotF [Paenibacillus sp. BK720]TCM96376.1 hypothetical protein EV294_105243 [Paenibacillus sp. BK033]